MASFEFSLALDKSCDVRDPAQLIIFIIYLSVACSNAVDEMDDNRKRPVNEDRCMRRHPGVEVEQTSRG